MGRPELVGVGIDIAEVSRFSRLLERSAARTWQHWFTPAEAEQCQQHPDPALAAALRFAVKEATYKSVGATFAEEVGWSDIEVLEASAPGFGTPCWQVDVRGDVATAARGVSRFLVSTHADDQRAWATVIAEAGGGHE